MHRIIALWTHPRSRSTIFERVMMERGDLQILHEPFSYLYYVHEARATIPQEYVDPLHPRTYPGIKDYIRSLARQSPIFFKDMCVHCLDHLCADDEFLQQLTHTFLIRDPSQAIASHYALHPQVSREEIGYEQLHSIFEKVAAFTGRIPAVVNADDLVENPHDLLQVYCRALGLPFLPEALHWEAGHKPVWDIWRQWHADAANSTRIEHIPKAYDIKIENSALLQSYYDYHLPFYDAMNQHRITITKHWRERP